MHKQILGHSRALSSGKGLDTRAQAEGSDSTPGTIELAAHAIQQANARTPGLCSCVCRRARTHHAGDSQARTIELAAHAIQQANAWTPGLCSCVCGRFTSPDTSGACGAIHKPGHSLHAMQKLMPRLSGEFTRECRTRAEPCSLPTQYKKPMPRLPNHARCACRAMQKQLPDRVLLRHTQRMQK